MSCPTFHTLHLVTPQRPIPTFLSALHSSPLKPLSVSEIVGWSPPPPATTPATETDAFNGLLALLIVLPGEDTQLPQPPSPSPDHAWTLKDSWSMTIKSDAGGPDSQKANRRLEGIANHLLSPEAQVEAENEAEWENEAVWWAADKEKWPAPMQKAVSPFFLYKRPLIAVDFSTKSHQPATPHPSTHLSGRVVRSHGNPRGGGWERVHLTRYASAEEYARAEAEAEAQRPSGVQKGEARLLVQQLKLPPEGERIDRMGWEFGNPHEPYGEDWFG